MTKFGVKEKSRSLHCFVMHTLPHFLESFACLCLGGAHFKQCVSTVKMQKNVTCFNYTLKHNNAHITLNKERKTTITCYWWLLVLCAFEMFLYKFGCDTDDMLTFPVLDHVQRL